MTRHFSALRPSSPLLRNQLYVSCSLKGIALLAAFKRRLFAFNFSAVYCDVFACSFLWIVLFGSWCRFLVTRLDLTSVLENCRSFSLHYFGCIPCLSSASTFPSSPHVSDSVLHPFQVSMLRCVFSSVIWSRILILSSALSNLLLNPSVEFLISVIAFFSFFFNFRFLLSAEYVHLVH